jgi:hypothetical protein
MRKLIDHQLLLGTGQTSLLNFVYGVLTIGAAFACCFRGVTVRAHRCVIRADISCLVKCCLSLVMYHVAIINSF